MKKLILTIALTALAAQAQAANEKCSYNGREFSHGAEHHGQRCEHGSWR